MTNNIKAISINPGVVGHVDHAVTPDFGIVSALERQINRRNEDAKTCIHEAAHTVAAVTFRFSIAWVSLDRDFIRADETAIKHECAMGDPLSMIISSDRLAPILDRRLMKTVEEKEIIRNYCTMVLAGPVAEQQFDPHGFDPEPCARDYGQVRDVLAILLKGFERKRFSSRAISAAYDFTVDRRREIASVAKALQERRTLFPEDIHRAIDASQNIDRQEAA